MELLGDVVVGLLMTTELMRRHPEASEGDLAWMRQGVVRTESCARVACAAGLPEALVAAAPARARERAAALAATPRVQAAVAEAVIGAGWLHLGHEASEPAVLAAFRSALEAAVPGRRDPKTTLQEEAARRRLDVAYELTAAEGPPHARTFASHALVGGEPLGSGSGRSKQASQAAAATEALARLVEMVEAG